MPSFLYNRTNLAFNFFLSFRAAEPVPSRRHSPPARHSLGECEESLLRSAKKQPSMAQRQVTVNIYLTNGGKKHDKFSV